MSYHIYFDGLFQGTFDDLDNAVGVLREWLNPLISFTFCDPITIIEDEPLIEGE
ncbi:MAG: hypothetical protein KAW52_00400 [candidate division Zixibacteria bacterium]|nr:hypothetical protein [candidate division Zixibacteria bacterium]